MCEHVETNISCDLMILKTSSFSEVQNQIVTALEIITSFHHSTGKVNILLSVLMHAGHNIRYVVVKATSKYWKYLFR